MNSKGQKAGHYAFFYYSALLIFSFAVLLTYGLTVFSVKTAYAYNEQPQPVTCPLTPQAGRTIVDFLPNDGLGSLTDPDVSHVVGPYSASIGAGTYDITLVGYDHHTGIGGSGSQNQLNEQYFLKLLNSNGELITTTSALEDIPNDQDYITTLVNSSFEIPQNIASIEAWHAAYPDNSSYNSHSPICAAFDLLAVPPVINTPPTITLIGANPITITVGDSYTDPGATATDAEDGDITSQIVASSTVNTAVAGTYTVTYNVVDSDGLAAVPVLRTVIVNPVLPAPFCGDGICSNSETCGVCSDCGSCSYGGGGGGGNVPIGNGPPEFGPTPPVVNTPTVLGVSTSMETAPVQCNYLLEYLKLGANNNPVEVYKLQIFLKNFEGFNDLRVTGIFDQTTFEAVSVFQEKYRQDVLEPWGDKVTTGYVYITTKKKVNEIYCRREFPLTDLQKQEIIDFRNIVNSLKTQGVTVPEAEAEEIFGGIGQAEEGQEGFSTSTLAVGINSEKNGFQKGAFSAALAYFSGLELLPSLLLFFLLFATTSLLLLLRKCKRERIYTPTVLPFGDE